MSYIGSEITIMKRDNLFINGKRINYNEIRRGKRTTDCHVFIPNKLLEVITEIQLNYEDKYDKRIMKSNIVNMALMMLTDELSDKSDDGKLAYINDMETEYKNRFK